MAALRCTTGCASDALLTPALPSARTAGGKAELESLRADGQIDPELDLDLDARAITAMVDGVGIATVIQSRAYPPRLQRLLVRRHLDRFTRG